MIILLISIALLKIYAAADVGTTSGAADFAIASLFLVSVAAFILAEKECTFLIAIRQAPIVIIYLFILFLVFAPGADTFGRFLSTIHNNASDISILKLLTIAFSAAVWEEIVFRRILLNLLLARLSTPLAVLTSAGAFWLLHISFLPVTFFGGAAFCLIVIRHRSIIAVVFLHFLFDVIGLFSEAFKTKFQDFSDDLPLGVMVQGANGLGQIVFSIGILAYLGVQLLCRKSGISSRSSDKN